MSLKILKYAFLILTAIFNIIWFDLICFIYLKAKELVNLAQQITNIIKKWTEVAAFIWHSK